MRVDTETVFINLRNSSNGVILIDDFHEGMPVGYCDYEYVNVEMCSWGGRCVVAALRPGCLILEFQ